MNLKTFLGVAAVGAAMAMAGPAAAQQNQQRIKDNFDLASTVETCAGCHGDHGKPVSDDIPIIWGQQFYYLYVQLKDFKAGRRQNDVMSPMASEFTHDEMKKLAMYFSKKSWPDIPAPKPTASAAHVKKLIADGQCTGCHNQFLGDSRLPRVAGQQYAYLIKTMNDLRTKKRNNAAFMESVMQSYQEQDLHDLAHYLAALRP